MNCRHAGLVGACLLLMICSLRRASAKDEPKWVEVHTGHFFVLTDAGEKRGREVALRMEQMRTTFGELILKNKLKMSVPITVVALKSDKQYGLIAPAKQTMASGFYVPGYDRVYIVLNLFEDQPWRSIAHALGHYFLTYNYPPVQGWFDEGMAEYFGSIQIDKQVNIGGDPELAPEWHEDIFDNMVRDPSTPQSLTQLVSSPVWIAMPDLFTMKHDSSGLHEGSHNTLYYAQSWIVVHYLINKKKMPEVGTYFGLVMNQKVPTDKAIIQAFDMSPAEFEESVKTYFNSLGNLGIALDQSKKPIANPGEIPQPDHFSVPFDADDLGVSVSAVAEEDAKAVIGDVMARIPEHREQALHDLQQLTTDQKDNEPARRGLARAFLQQNEFDRAADELEKAGDLNAKDPWIWYYRSVLRYRKAQATRQDMQGIANMMQDLRSVLDWYPDLADAYNMLGVARLEGGGINSALDAQKQAIALAPRNIEYQFNLGQIYVAGKKWEQAQEVFTHIKDGPDRQAASAAKKQLEDLATLQKYGVPAQHAGETEAPLGAASTPSAAKANSAKSVETTSNDEDTEATPKPEPPKPGTTGPVLFLKGKIVQSDCTQSREASVTFLSGMTTYKMHVADYKSLLVIGDSEFSCEWKNRLASVNYRATGKLSGEVLSIEIH